MPARKGQAAGERPGAAMMQMQAWLQGRSLRQESALREAVLEARKVATSSREETGKKRWCTHSVLND